MSLIGTCLTPFSRHYPEILGTSFSSPLPGCFSSRPMQFRRKQLDGAGLRSLLRSRQEIMLPMSADGSARQGWFDCTNL
jgi:hypothetical protein